MPAQHGRPGSGPDAAASRIVYIWGAPSTGKTHLARNLAEQSGRLLAEFDLSEALSHTFVPGDLSVLNGRCVVVDPFEEADSEQHWPRIISFLSSVRHAQPFQVARLARPPHMVILNNIHLILVSQSPPSDAVRQLCNEVYNMVASEA